MSASDPLGIIGTTVAGKYRIVAVAGEGGFSTVYKAEHLIWEQAVAIKFFHVLADADPAMREALLDDFIQEGKVMSELSSRSAAVVQARDIGKLARDDDSWIPYMVLEWLDGTPLDVLVKAERRKGEPPRQIGDTLRMLDQAAKALDLAHRTGIAHRDLKPANLMIIGDPNAEEVTIKLLDFGIAKVMAERGELDEQLELTGQKITAFTPNHGAPEQFSRNYGATGPWTDVYAMALIMIEVMQSGAPALEGDSFYELGVSSCSPDRRPTPRTFGLEVSDEVEALFATALAIHPADRFETMGAFFKELNRAVFPAHDTWRSGATQHSHPNPPSFRGAPVSTTTGALIRNPAAARPASRSGLFLGAAALAIAASGATYAVVQGNQATPEAGPAALAQALSPTTLPATPSAPAACPATMKMVPGGTFGMGSDDDGFALWKPAHEVTLDTYCLDVHEVTVADYQTCVDGGGCNAADNRPDYPQPASHSAEAHSQQLSAFAELCNAGKPSRSDHPINCVDWHRASTYCDQLGQRLPTEAEWEYAARGTDGRSFPWGNDAGNESYMNAGGTEWKAWLAGHSLPQPSGLMFEADDGYPGTAPVGRYPRAQTQRGHMDMVGNVWEWTSDWYAVYPAQAQRNPKGPDAGERKAIRGGGFNGEFALWMKPAARYHQLATASVHAVGFRCAKTVGKAQ
jgi:eukaryotic-like serine/threonine-protein kinase